MKKFISKSASTVVMLYALAAPSFAFAGTWVVREDPMGPGYIVTDDETGTIHTQGKKAANKIAKTLNNTDVVDSNEGPCHDPSSGVVC